MKSVFAITLVFLSACSTQPEPVKYDPQMLSALVEEMRTAYGSCEIVGYRIPNPGEIEIREAVPGLCGSFTTHIIVYVDGEYFSCPTIRYTVAHELLHALGYGHGEHYENLHQFDSIVKECTGEES